jgi:hypothetical protein
MATQLEALSKRVTYGASIANFRQQVIDDLNRLDTIHGQLLAMKVAINADPDLDEADEASVDDAISQMETAVTNKTLP